MRKQIVLLFLVGFFISNGQEIVVNENFNVSETELYIEGFEMNDVYFKLGCSFFQNPLIYMRGTVLNNNSFELFYTFDFYHY